MKTAVRAHEIATLLDDMPHDVRCLSLDCFDTLIWRNAQAPRDVFAELPLPGGGIEPRANVESRLRSERIARDGLNEVTIDQIYERLLPNGTGEERTAWIARELEAEARHCFAFTPTVELIRAAKAKGLQVIIVSDTYLSNAQLRTLVARAAGEDVVAMIDRFFCSCEVGKSKAQGMFGPVLAALGLPARSIVHLGDNYAADADAPRELGINGIHFEQFESVTDQRLRLEAAAATLIDPAVRITRPALQPHRPQISLREQTGPADRLGHDVLGPVMHGFAHWIRDEAEALGRERGRPVKILFLLRDGYLPHQAYMAAGFGEASAVEISRFTSIAASFADEEAIRSFLVSETSKDIDFLGKQLLLNPGEVRQIGRNSREFRKNVLGAQWVKRIRTRSQEFAQRLAAHLRREANVQPGDVLMLVDLGYNGSVQNHAEAALSATLQVEVAGRYLLLRERWPTGLDKKGMIDIRHYETRVVDALCGPVAVLEQLCTIAQGSVVGYHANGNPIRKAADVKGGQSAVRDAVQAACLDFVREAGKGTHRPAASHDAEGRRQVVAATLSRLLYLPLTEEVALLEQFDHDVNLGTQATIKLINDEVSGDQLRRRGLPYISVADRMYLPGEVQRHGFPLALSLSLVGRFGLDLRHTDFNVGSIDVPVLLADARGQTLIMGQAHSTHDGYYLLTVPAGTGAFAIGVQLGTIAEVVQVDEIAFYPVEDFTTFGCEPAAPAAPLLDGMETIAPGLHKCQETGLIFVPPPTAQVEEPMLLAVTFRPVVRRAAGAVAGLAKAA
jgi:FMN phosphatase YigB (HAD superfamily)